MARSKGKKRQQVARDVAASRNATWEDSGARDRGGRLTVGRPVTQPNRKAVANKKACRKRIDY